MKKIAVFGANGRLGHEVVKAFAGNGWLVHALTRKGDYHQTNNVVSSAVDAMDRASVIAAVDDSDVIFNGLNPNYTKWKVHALPMAQNVLAAAEHSGALHLFPGNVYNYGSSIPRIANEKTPLIPDTRKGKIRVDMEALFEKSANEGKSRTLILRAGDFFGGTGTGSWFDITIVKKLEKGVFTYPGPLDCPHTWAYLPDLAAAFVGLANKEPELAPFETMQFEGHIITGEHMQQALETITGKPLKYETLPWPIIRAIGLVYPMYREIAEVSYLWKKPHQLCGKKLMGHLSELQHTPLVDALTQALIDQEIRVSNSRKQDSRQHWQNEKSFQDAQHRV